MRQITSELEPHTKSGRNNFETEKLNLLKAAQKAMQRERHLRAGTAHSGANKNTTQLTLQWC